jgi:hypothetical protein
MGFGGWYSPPMKKTLDPNVTLIHNNSISGPQGTAGINLEGLKVVLQ